jgi:putative ABC transport system permease protein
MLPKWVSRFLRAVCPEEVYEHIEGDLIELYEHDLKSDGKRKAMLRLVMATLSYLRPAILLRNKLPSGYSDLSVLRNYLKTTFRHIGKSKLNFVFRLGGLTLSIFCFVIITIYVSYQLSFDKFHDDHELIYRVNSARMENGNIEEYAVAPLALGPMLGQEFPEIAAAGRMRFANGSNYLTYNNVVTDCELLIEADASIFSVLTFRFLKGNANALKRPNRIVLSRTLAERMFDTPDVLGKLITVSDSQGIYEVAAVVEDMPANSTLFVGALIPMQEERDFTLSSIISPVEFVDYAAITYVRFRESIPDDFSSRVESMLDRYIGRADRTQVGFRVFLQPLTDIYQGAKYKMDYTGGTSTAYLYALLTLGVLLLVVASINYINLSIVDVAGRSRETGVRQVLGAQKRHLILQLAVEVFVYCLVSLVISVLLLYAFFPRILQLIDSDLRFEMLLRQDVLLVVAVGVILLIFFSAAVPSRVLTRPAISQNLKNAGVSFNSSISRALLFAQFGISALCICCTLMVGRQVGFIHNKSLGIDRKNLIVVSLPSDFTVAKMVALKHRLKQLPGVTAVSNSSFRIGGGYWKDWYFVESGEEIKQVELYEVFSDDELFETLGIKPITGRTFRADIPSDSGAAFVINETAARALGWEEPIGKRIYTHPEEPGEWDGTIVGVVPDINISALYEKVQPLVMRLPWQNGYPDAFVYIRYAGDEQAVIKSIETQYAEIMPGYPLQFLYVDTFYNSRHAKEAKAFTSLKFGTVVIVLVSLIGVFSLAAYISARRMREFGIRKVLGASGNQIAGLQFSFFVRIALISNLFALPVAYWLVGEWLAGFAYRIDLGIFPFVMVGAGVILLVLMSGSHAAFKAARMNPVDVIKLE